MNSNMGTSGCSSTSVRQGFYDETEKSKHHHPSPQYPSSNSSSHHHHNLHRSWLDSHMGGGRGVGGEGGSNSPLDHLMMDSSPTHVSRTTTTTGGGGGEDAEESQSQTIMRELGQEVGGQSGVAAAVVVEKEHMFDKVVTPSDVGKLNRLVIPKQHAERYFPLDSSTNEKGLLLNFEDRNGKPWRFRYSYWNSSQSYVMTKGWSRFVKEKKLDAGDIVSFQRGVGELAKDRLFIDWRRRPDAPPQELLNPVLANLSFPHHFSFQRSSNSSSSNMNIHHHPWNPMFLQTHQAGVPVPPAPPYSQQRGAHHAYSNSHLLQPQSNYINNMSTSTSSYGAYGGGGPVGPYGYNISGNSTSHVVNPCSSSVIYFRSASAAPQQQLGMVQMQRASHGGFHVPSSPGGIGIGIGNDPPPVVFESVPVVHGKAAAKRLRLFGVNMDCAMPPEDEGNECEILTPTTNTAAAATDQIMNMSYYNAHPPMCFEGYTTQNHYICSSNSSTSSLSTIPYLQLRPYSGTQIQTLVQQYPPSSSSTTSDKGKASMSLDLDI